MRKDRKVGRSDTSLAAFLKADGGAVTADWVVLSAAVTGFGVTSAAAVHYGSGDLANGIRDALSNASVMLMGTLGHNTERYVDTTLSDGRIQRDVYVGDRLVRREWTDPTNAHSWASMVVRYNENGVRVAEDIVYDDGRISESTFVNNIIATRRFSDPNDAHSWKTLNDVFDERGVIVSREAVNNNNTTYSETYTEGRVTERIHRTPEGAITQTEEHSYVLDAQGRWQERHIAYGDGQQLVTYYENGRAVSQSIVDTQNAHNWNSQNWTWNAQGQLATYDITRNDGTREEAVYTNNLISTYNHFNAAGQQVSSEARTYDSAGRLTGALRTAPDGTLIQNDQRSYNSLGQLATQGITYSDGRQYTATYTNGLRSAEVWVDPENRHWWSRQEATFDSNNRMMTNTVIGDTGSGYTDTYAAGLITRRVETDASGNITGTSNWTYQLDSLNRVQVRNIAYSDGRESVTTYSGNLPTQQTIADTQNRHWWRDQVITYDSMGRTANAIVNYEDGRQYEDIYTVGVLTQRIYRDALGNVTSVTNY